MDYKVTCLIENNKQFILKKIVSNNTSIPLSYCAISLDNEKLPNLIVNPLDNVLADYEIAIVYPEIGTYLKFKPAVTVNLSLHGDRALLARDRSTAGVTGTLIYKSNPISLISDNKPVIVSALSLVAYNHTSIDACCTIHITFYNQEDSVLCLYAFDVEKNRPNFLLTSVNQIMATSCIIKIYSSISLNFSDIMVHGNSAGLI